MTMNVILAGRTDTDEFFRISGVFESEELNHTPLLVFHCDGDCCQVKIIHKPLELLNYPDETPVMGQWRGEWRSDFFQFRVRDFRQFLARKDELLKSAKNVRRIVGPKGGFRCLSHEYRDDSGIHCHRSTSNKLEVQRLEKLFKECEIEVVQEVQK